MLKWRQGMNYIILNGKKSNLLRGLLISSLPPISKPKKRVQIEEIDGVDGDIVSSLGYSAYDKTVKIGLFGTYDINDIISYFDSEGIVTFSNEPDKFYYYQILEQIDFERLRRFKEAKVKFHVQPFKYSLIEKLLDKDFNLLHTIEYQEEKKGIILSSYGNNIKIQGTATEATEIYVPINNIEIDPDEYVLSAESYGISPNEVAVRLINNTPSNSNSFGGRYVYLTSGKSIIKTKNTSKKRYNYLWFNILPNVEVDISVSIKLEGSSKIATITNVGNTISKPTITIYGSGNIYIYLNNKKIFDLNLNDEEYITINSSKMEAYKNKTLKNRLVSGNYDDFSFNVGRNTIYFIGDVSKFDIVNYSRWI